MDHPICNDAHTRKRKTDEEEMQSNVQVKAPKTLNCPATSEPESGDLFYSRALEDAQRAIQRAIAAAKDRLHAVNEGYHAGVKIGQDTQVLGETTALKHSTDLLCSMTDDIELKRNGAFCYKLPAEIIYEVFKYLDMDSLLHCRGTCARWKSLLGRKAHQIQQWKATPVRLCGTLAEIEMRWDTVRELCESPSTLSLKIESRQSSKMQNSPPSIIRELLTKLNLSSRNLQRFEFQGSYRDDDEKIWESITQCQNLKILHWRYLGDPETPFDTTPGWGQKGKLPLCAPEELRLDVASDFILDADALIQISDRLKRFCHIRGLERNRFLVIMIIAETSLEELTVQELRDASFGYYYHLQKPRKDSGYIMQSLRKICFQDVNIGVLSITAPNASTVQFDHGKIIDWTLIDSCRWNLKNLHIETKGIATEGRLSREIFDMPQLEELHLDFRRGSRRALLEDDRGGVPSYETYSIAAFWQVACSSSDITRVQSIFPKLKKLKIVHDPLLDEATLSKFITNRALSGQNTIEQVNIYLANHASEGTRQLESLESELPGLSYKLFEQWKAQDTREWRLRHKLHLYGDLGDWKMNDACRNILQSLSVYVDNTRMAERVQDELFRMPQLADLKLCFYDSSHNEGKWSAAALWKVLSTGVTGSDRIFIEEILPCLDKLHVSNDATLDQGKIVNMVAMREKLGLAAVKSIYISLARTFSGDRSKLDDLARRYAGYSFHGCIY